MMIYHDAPLYAAWLTMPGGPLVHIMDPWFLLVAVHHKPQPY